MLTEEQATIVEAAKEFLKPDNGEKFFLISAPAGTGKTFLTKYIYTDVYYPNIELLTQYPRFIFTATTHKAVDALEIQLGLGSNNIPIPVQEIKTIHSLLGLEVSYDLDKGETNLKLKDNAEIVKNAIIIVDECSMIDNVLLKFIECRTHKCKVIFIGDDKQLPPVKSGKIPPVFTYPRVPTHTLTKTIRNQDHEELKDLCSLLRESIAEEKATSIVITGNIHYLNEEDFLKQIKQDFLEPTITNKILAYTNKRVNYYNELVAKIREKPQYYNQGDYYVLADILQVNKILLYTDTELRIEYLSQLNTDPYYDIRYYDAKIVVPYTDISGKERADSPSFYIRIPESFDELKNLLKTLKTAAAKESDSGVRRMRWREYFVIKESYADLRYRDASTVHKSQGTTLKNVYIDLSDLGICKNFDTFNKLLYVAVSRARENIYFTGTLPTKYGSIILRN